MTTKRYNLSNLDVTVQNANDLNEVEHRVFNESARQAAQRLIDSLKGKSPDFVQRVGEWAYDMGTSHKRKTKARTPGFENADLFQDRDENGRYSANPDEPLIKALEEAEKKKRMSGPLADAMDKRENEDWLNEAIRDYKAKLDNANQSNLSPEQNDSYVLRPGHKWAEDKTTGKVIQVPRTQSAPKTPAVGAGSGLPNKGGR